MARDVAAATHRCCPGDLTTSIAEKCDHFGSSWNRIGGFGQNLKPSLGSKKLSLLNKTSFWGTTFFAQRKGGAIADKDIQHCSRSRLFVSASCSQPKPPIFVLKKPQRKPILSDEDITSGTPMSETEDNEVGRFSVDENHKSGYVALIGKPNVGKSTLLNQIIGQKLSIVTNKPQTTRHCIIGICSASDYQIILYDTPGIMPKITRRLDEMMMRNVRSSTFRADCVLVIVDACHAPEKVLEEGTKTVSKKRPTLIVLNKVDLIKPGEIARKIEWYQTYTDGDGVLPVSAKFGHGVDAVKRWVVDQLPNGPAYYPKDIVSEHTERFFVSEIVREKIVLQYRQEIPYVSQDALQTRSFGFMACLFYFFQILGVLSMDDQVNVLNYIERTGESKDFIEAEVVVERGSQMSILIGKDGAALKLLSTASRLDIEKFVGKQVYLKLRVKVREKWREDDELLEYYGYKGEIRS